MYSETGTILSNIKPKRSLGRLAQYEHEKSDDEDEALTFLAIAALRKQGRESKFTGTKKTIKSRLLLGLDKNN